MSRKVYLFRAAQFYKIGISGNINKRLSQLQTGCPIKCEYIGYLPAQDPSYLEKQLHIRFNNFKTYGEWFDLGDDNIRILITEFNLKHVINPYIDPSKIDEVASASPHLIKTREISADISEFVKLYESYYPGHTLTDNGKITIRKLIGRYSSEAVFEGFSNAALKFDFNKVFSVLPHAVRNYAEYGRHINESTWKAYYSLKKDAGREVASEYLKFVMSKGLDKIGYETDLKNAILSEIDEYSIESIMQVFYEELMDGK